MDIVFGTDGWRARMDESFTIENVKLVAQAIAEYIKQENLKSKGLVIGYDTRANSKVFAYTCSKVLSENNIHVYLGNRPMPTPITAFAITSLQAAGAIMITASHNPAEYNGIKFIPEYAGPATPDITNKIVSNIRQITPDDLIRENNVELTQTINPLSDYTSYLENLIDFDVLRNKKLKIVLDPMYGAGYGIANTIFEKAGCQVYAIHNHEDSSFGGSLPEPTLKNLKELKSLIKDKNAHLGLALDGDADRFGVIDSEGNYIRANQVLALLSLHLIKNRKSDGILVRSIATTHFIDAIAKAHNIEVYETPQVGFKYIAQAVLEKSVILGGEESGGLCIKGSIPEKDGILADLLLAEVTAYENKSLTALLDEMYEQYGLFIDERLDIRFPLEKKEALLNKLTKKAPKKIAGKKLTDVCTTDGVRYTLEAGDWILTRPSGTEPLVRIYIESCTKEGFEQLKAYAKSMLDKI